MLLGAEFLSVLFGLGAAASWGIGDFSGGYASRRAPMLQVIVFSQFIGFLMLLVLAWLQHEQITLVADVLWGAAAGIIGAAGLIALYRALAIGKMSIAAPITAVLGAGIPVIITALTEGLPKPQQLLGFSFALVGIWLISRSQDASNTESSSTRNAAVAQSSPSFITRFSSLLTGGIGLALVGGLFFGLFFTFMGQFSENAVFLPLVIARSTSIPLMIALALARRQLQIPPRNMLGVITFAGMMDAGGNIGFVLAAQTGRLDIASVLSSLYPATTVILAVLILKERLSRWQTIGMVLVLTAIVLIAAA